MPYNHEKSLLDASTKQSSDIHVTSFTTGRTEKRNLHTKAAFLLHWPFVNKHTLTCGELWEGQHRVLQQTS